MTKYVYRVRALNAGTIAPLVPWDAPRTIPAGHLSRRYLSASAAGWRVLFWHRHGIKSRIERSEPIVWPEVSE